MSFSKPTIASQSRVAATKEEVERRTGGRLTTLTNVLVNLPRQLFKDGATSTPHAAEHENDTHARQPHSLTGSHAMREFTSRCDDVIRRAHHLLEHTRDQEQLLTRAVDARATSTTTPSPHSHADCTTTVVVSAPAARDDAEGELTCPVHTAPVASPELVPCLLLHDGAAAPTTMSTHELNSTESASPVPRLPPCPPPTPATGADAATATPVRDALPESHPTTPTPSAGNLFQRLFNSLQRLSGQPPQSASPSPPPPPQSRSLARLFSPGRKSVRFASPDKLESVTPTKPPSVESAGANVEDATEPVMETVLVTETETATETVTAGSSRKRARCATPSQTRPSLPTPPAPPPSAVKSPTAPRGSRGQHDGAAEVADAPPSVDPPCKPVRKELKKAAAVAAKARRKAKRSKRASAGAPSLVTPPTQTAPPPRHSTEHMEMLQFIRHHSTKECLARFTKKTLLHFLHADGVLCRSPARSKRKLLEEVRAVCGV